LARGAKSGTERPEGEDLWPADLFEEIPVTPAEVLKRQAAWLGKRTGGLVTAQVRSEAVKNGEFLHSFEIKAPALAGYSHVLLTLRHDIQLYPVSDGATEEEYRDQAELEAYLRRLFGHAATLKLVRTLIAQSRASAEPV